MRDSSAIIYLNGEYLPKAQAALSIEDRGVLFGDGVYEVLRFYHGRPLRMEAHLERLRRSMKGIRLDEPEQVAHLPRISMELVQRNNLPDAKVYWQVTRGAAPRDHLFPAAPVQPTVLAIAYPASPLEPAGQVPAWRAILVEDLRWSCCWIKSLMLMPNVLARNQAHQANCQEAILHRQGRVTEGSSSNAFIVRDGTLWTHPADQWILDGVTRRLVLELAHQQGLPVREEAFTVDQLLAADEVLLTGTTTHVAAVTHVDGRTIGSGKIGPVAQQLHRAFVQHVTQAC